MIKIELDKSETNIEIEGKDKSIKEELIRGLPVVMDSILTKVCTSATEKKSTIKLFVKRMQELGLLEGGNTNHEKGYTNAIGDYSR